MDDYEAGLAELTPQLIECRQHLLEAADSERYLADRCKRAEAALVALVEAHEEAIQEDIGTFKLMEAHRAARAFLDTQKKQAGGS